MPSCEIIGSSFGARITYKVTQDIQLNRSVVRVTKVEMRSLASMNLSCYIKGSITIFCKGAMARARVEGQITHGMVGIPVTAEWDEEWEGLSKTLKVRCGEVSRIVSLDGDGPVCLPQECLIAGQRLECGLDGWDASGKLRIPTNWASCGMVKPSVAQCDGPEGAQPTPGTVEEMLLRLKAAEEEIQKIQQGTGSSAGGNGPTVYCWGDSLTEGVGGWLPTQEGIQNAIVCAYPDMVAKRFPCVNLGCRGETIQTIMARQGADPMMVGGFTIPADASEDVIVG